MNFLPPARPCLGASVQDLSIWHTDQLQVITVMMGSAGYKAGIYAGDLITTITREVDGLGKPLEKPEVIPTKGLLRG